MIEIQVFQNTDPDPDPGRLKIPDPDPDPDPGFFKIPDPDPDPAKTPGSGRIRIRIRNPGLKNKIDNEKKKTRTYILLGRKIKLGHTAKYSAKSKL